MLAALHVLAALGGQDGPLSELVAQYDRYAASGEINTTVDDQAGRLAAIKAAYENREGVTLDELDGLTVTAATGGSTSAPPTPSRCSASTSRPATGHDAQGPRRGTGDHPRLSPGEPVRAGPARRGPAGRRRSGGLRAAGAPSLPPGSSSAHRTPNPAGTPARHLRRYAGHTP